VLGPNHLHRAALVGEGFGIQPSVMLGGAALGIVTSVRTDIIHAVRASQYVNPGAVHDLVLRQAQDEVDFIP
jgi:hypothetical protein